MGNKLENIISSESTFSLNKKVQAEPNRGQICEQELESELIRRPRKIRSRKSKKKIIDLETGWFKKQFSWKAKSVITKWETNREIWCFSNENISLEFGLNQTSRKY